MSHCDEGTLVMLVDGELGGSELEVAKQHVEGCQQCRDLLAEVRQLKSDAMGLIGTLEVPELTVTAGGPDPSDIPMFSMAPKAAAWTGEHASFKAASMVASARAAAVAAAPPPEPARPRRRWIPGLALAATILLAAGIGYRLGTERAAPALPAPIREAAARTPAEPAPSQPSAAGKDKELGDQVATSSNLAAKKTRSEVDEKALGRLQKAVAPAPATVVAAAPPVPDSTLRPAPAPAQSPAAERRDADGAAAGFRQRAEAKRASRKIGDTPVRLEETVTSGRSVAADSAIRLLGGTIKLIDGLTPLRYEQAGPAVRIVYQVLGGTLVLTERRTEGGIVFQLEPPAGAPADSVSAWRARIK